MRKEEVAIFSDFGFSQTFYNLHLSDKILAFKYMIGILVDKQLQYHHEKMPIFIFKSPKHRSRLSSRKKNNI